MKFALFTADGIGCPIAYHMQEEGTEVYVGQVNTWDKLGIKTKEKPDAQARRLSVYDGLFSKKLNADSLLDYLLNRPLAERVEWFIFCDANFMWAYAKPLIRAGYCGLLPTETDYSLEKDRRKAKALVQKKYDMVAVGEYKEFKHVKDGLEYLDDNQDTLYVLKGFNADAPTVVPDSDKPDINHLMIVDAMEANIKSLEVDGFLLEEKVSDIIEFTPEAIAYDGQVVAVSVDIEHKMMGSRNGPLTGCSACMVFWQELDSLIYEYFLAPLEEMMFRENQVTIWDMSVYWSPSRKKFFFGEFCFNREGYDSVFAEIATVGSPTEYFEGLRNGRFFKDPASFGVSVCMFGKDSTVNYKRELIVGDIADANIWVLDCKKEQGKIYTAGSEDRVIVFSAAGETVEDAIPKLYKNVKKIEYDSGLCLQERDWFDTEFKENMLYRMSVLNKLEIDADPTRSVHAGMETAESGSLSQK